MYILSNGSQYNLIKDLLIQDIIKITWPNKNKGVEELLFKHIYYLKITYPLDVCH